MITFFIAAALLVVLCVVWLLYGLFRHPVTGVDQEAVNVTLARERRQQLDEALAEGTLDADAHEAEMQQLTQDLAADLRLHTDRQRQGKLGNIVVAGLIAIAVPITAGTLYLKLGDPTAIDATGANASAVNSGQPPSLTDLIPRLEARLAESPEDVDGWRLLGRTYLSMNTFDKAQLALEMALALEKRHAPTLAQLAESIAMQRGGELAGEPMNYLQRAIRINPEHEHSRWLLAIALQQAGDHEAALAGFDRLASQAQDNPQALATIDQMRQRSLDALSAEMSSADDDNDALNDTELLDATPAENGAIDEDTAARAPGQGKRLAVTTDDQSPGSARIDVLVKLDDTAAKAVQGNQVVFVYARASDGPPMPLAVERLLVDQLPATVTLDDSMAMMPSLKLSSFPEVTIGARVSASGNAIAQSGDWFGELRNVQPTKTDALNLTINAQTP